MDCLSQQLGEPLLAALRVVGLDSLRLIDASFDDVDGAVELVTSLADPFLDKYISDHFGTYHEAGAVLARAIESLEGRTAAMRRRTAATTGPAVFEHFARLAQDAPALPHPALAGDVASAWVKQTAWRTARQRAIAAADSATARADVETAEHRKWADAWRASSSMPRSLPPRMLLSFETRSAHCGVHAVPDGPRLSVCGCGTGSASALGLSPSLVARGPLTRP